MGLTGWWGEGVERLERGMPLAVGSVVGGRGVACVCGEREKLGASASAELGISAVAA